MAETILSMQDELNHTITMTRSLVVSLVAHHNEELEDGPTIGRGDLVNMLYQIAKNLRDIEEISEKIFEAQSLLEIDELSKIFLETQKEALAQ